MRHSTRRFDPHKVWLLLIGPAALSAGFAGAASPQEPEVATAPEMGVRWRGVSGGLLFFGGLVALDEPVHDANRNVQTGVGNTFAGFGRWYGDWHRSAPLMVGGTLVLGAALGGSRGVARGGSVMIGVVAGSMANEAVNIAVGRGRPANGSGPWQFRPFAGYQAFPSGHAAYTFAFAGAIDAATDSWITTTLAYSAATFTALSRVYDDRHWLSDVVVGALVGGWTAHRATKLSLGMLGLSKEGAGGKYAHERNAIVELLLRLEPVANGRFVGFRLRV